MEKPKDAADQLYSTRRESIAQLKVDTAQRIAATFSQDQAVVGKAGYLGSGLTIGVIDPEHDLIQVIASSFLTRLDFALTDLQHISRKAKAIVPADGNQGDLLSIRQDGHPRRRSGHHMSLQVEGAIRRGFLAAIDSLLGPNAPHDILDGYDPASRVTASFDWDREISIERAVPTVLPGISLARYIDESQTVPQARVGLAFVIKKTSSKK